MLRKCSDISGFLEISFWDIQRLLEGFVGKNNWEFLARAFFRIFVSRPLNWSVRSSQARDSDVDQLTFASVILKVSPELRHTLAFVASVCVDAHLVVSSTLPWGNGTLINVWNVRSNKLRSLSFINGLSMINCMLSLWKIIWLLYSNQAFDLFTQRSQFYFRQLITGLIISIK